MPSRPEVRVRVRPDPAPNPDEVWKWLLSPETKDRLSGDDTEPEAPKNPAQDFSDAREG